MSEDAVVVTRAGAVAIIRFNEPKSMNALSMSIRNGFERAVDQVVPDPEVRAIVLTGTGNAFCAGGDIRMMGQKRAPEIRLRMQGAYKWLGAFLKSEKPVIVAVNGAAAGAGMSIALSGDIIIASREAFFMSAFTKLGACPDLGLLATLPRAIGTARAKDILMTSRKVSAEEAWQMGLVSRLADPDKLMTVAMETAEAVAAAPTVTMGLIKRLMLRSFDPSIDEFLEMEGFAQAVAQSTEDFEEGVAAFRDKRKAKFKGR